MFINSKTTILSKIFLLFSVIYCATAIDIDDDLGFTDVGLKCTNGSDVEDAPAWVKYGGFLLLFVIVIQMFWALALICEEFFVPALTVLCEEFKIPDDVAGATFMAAGASSPELFTAMIGLLVYDSNIGVGTVVGSEIFNHMIISAGSVLFAKDGVLHLDARIVTRDLVAYAMALLILIWALKDRVYTSLPHAFDSNSWDACLHVTVLHSTMIVVVYGIYAAVAGNFKRLTLNLCPRIVEKEEEDQEAEGSTKADPNPSDYDTKAPIITIDNAERPSAIMISKPSITGGRAFRAPSLYQWDQDATTELLGGRSLAAKRMSQTPIGELSSDAKDATTDQPMGVELRSVLSPLAPEQRDKSGEVGTQDIETDAARSTIKVADIDMDVISKNTIIPGAATGNHLMLLQVLGVAPREDLGVVHTSSNVTKCFLSIYQDQLKLDALAPYYTWELRQFTIDHYGLHSVSDPEDHHTGQHVEIVSLIFAEQVIVTNKLQNEFMIVFGDTLPCVQLRAPSPEILTLILERLRLRIQQFQAMKLIDREILLSDAQTHLWKEHEHVHSLLTWPRGRYARVWHFLCYPLSFMFEYTVVDVRVSDQNRAKYPQIICICVGYLAALSYIMILCCDYIGSWIGTTPTVMGLTLSAVGTSFPNLWSSMIVARQGYGNMAIGNALGSNIFNICIALGLPWLIKNIVLGGKPYQEMKDDGIVMFIVLLEFVCVIWYAMIAAYGFKIYAWMAWVFIVIYFVVLITAVWLS
jgi:K+-dependent Na+/Ca+ exchanger-like protein